MESISRFWISLFFILFNLIQQAQSSYSHADGVDPSRSRQISVKPRAFVYEGFLTDEECDHLISLAKSELTRSSVADNLSGKSVLSEVRTSSGMFINKAKDEIVSGIEDKIAAWTFIPKENGEDIQVLHYEYGQKYEPHYDYFTDTVNTLRGGHRIATVLLYLSDVEKGGETVFPLAEELKHHRGAHVKDDTLSECAQRGIAGKHQHYKIRATFPLLHSNPFDFLDAVKPRKGDALLFFNLLPDATTDPKSLHAGCPVIEGEKWSATKWIRVASFDKVYHTGGNCTDQNESCAKWAALGECTKNPAYMVGTADLPGYCKRSCNVC
ncbi:putative prolyl 4-hydroxylase 4 isoform X1 [Carex littledalei]|uniref:procollagen-proline 4-dioxygenase n=1 Tax=Carex littledalei TaxID=544730 RepID=A0A833VEW5_9POAL|nr:putative prolyl 4-hydroxylase 4 isoform X1 [Carex littledalei]